MTLTVEGGGVRHPAGGRGGHACLTANGLAVAAAGEMARITADIAGMVAAMTENELGWVE